tara:strand:+ start:521 stop:622 length:102 start_codon:yes stop_codon:yes gene_type:complete
MVNILVNEAAIPALTKIPEYMLGIIVLNKIKIT